MIKVAINGAIFECQTPAEAVEIAKRMGNGRNVVSNHPSSEDVGGTLAASLSPQAFKFLRSIHEMPATEVSSGDLALALEVKGATGIGPRLTKIEDELSKLKPPVKLLSEILEKEERIGQTVKWRVRPTAKDVFQKFYSTKKSA